MSSRASGPCGSKRQKPIDLDALLVGETGQKDSRAKFLWIVVLYMAISTIIAWCVVSRANSECSESKWYLPNFVAGFMQATGFLIYCCMAMSIRRQVRTGGGLVRV